MNTLKEKFKAKAPLQKEEFNHLKQHQEHNIGSYNIGQVIGGMRGITGLTYETSLLDSNEGIRFRGYSIPELRDALPKYKESVDMGLYKSRSNLRILNCYKVEREIVDGLSPYQDNGKVNVTRQKKALFPETLTLSQSLVSYTNGLNLLTIKLE
jgi:hypothetical protein